MRKMIIKMLKQILQPTVCCNVASMVRLKRWHTIEPVLNQRWTRFFYNYLDNSDAVKIKPLKWNLDEMP